MDAYTAARASEKLGNSLSKVIYTTSFLDKALLTQHVDSSIVPEDAADKRKAWESMVETQVIPETGIIGITTYGTSPEQAINLANAIGQILMYENWEYHGGGENVSVVNINQALASNVPAKPNIFLNVAGALIIGFLGSFSFFVVKQELKQRNSGKVDFPGSKGEKDDDFNPKKPLYRVLDHQTFPEFEFAFAENSEPTTIHDHLK